MKSVAKFTIKQKVFLNVVYVILIVAGLFAIFNIPIENMPTVDIGKVFITTPYYGAPAQDVEKLVTKKIEDALDGLDNVEYIQSRSYRNFSTVIVKFNDDVEYRDLYDELRFRTLNIKDELPDGAEEPTFLYLDTHVWMPVIVTNLTGDIPPRSLKLYAEELKTQLLSIPNVRNVDIIGEFDHEFHISIDPAKLRKYGITFNQAASAIESANTKIPTGRFRQDSFEYMLEAGKRISSQQQALDVIVRKDGDGNYIRVKDLVTSARLSYQDPRTIPSVNGENTLRLQIIKEEKGNSVTIAQKVKQVSDLFAKRYKDQGINIVYTKDSTIEIDESINTLGGELDDRYDSGNDHSLADHGLSECHVDGCGDSFCLFVFDSDHVCLESIVKYHQFVGFCAGDRYYGRRCRDYH